MSIESTFIKLANAYLLASNNELVKIAATAWRSRWSNLSAGAKNALEDNIGIPYHERGFMGRGGVS